jgi:hypothetical protein
LQRVERALAYAASVANSTGSTTDGSSFSGLLTRVEIGHIRWAGDGLAFLVVSGMPYAISG